jgi:hypothetical protein
VYDSSRCNQFSIIFAKNSTFLLCFFLFLSINLQFSVQLPRSGALRPLAFVTLRHARGRGDKSADSGQTRLRPFAATWALPIRSVLITPARGLRASLGERGAGTKKEAILVG